MENKSTTRCSHQSSLKDWSLLITTRWLQHFDSFRFSRRGGTKRSFWVGLGQRVCGWAQLGKPSGGWGFGGLGCRKFCLWFLMLFGSFWISTWEDFIFCSNWYLIQCFAASTTPPGRSTHHRLFERVLAVWAATLDVAWPFLKRFLSATSSRAANCYDYQWHVMSYTKTNYMTANLRQNLRNMGSDLDKGWHLFVNGKPPFICRVPRKKRRFSIAKRSYQANVLIKNGQTILVEKSAGQLHKSNKSKHFLCEFPAIFAIFAAFPRRNLFFMRDPVFSVPGGWVVIARLAYYRACFPREKELWCWKRWPNDRRAQIFKLNMAIFPSKKMP